MATKTNTIQVVRRVLSMEGGESITDTQIEEAINRALDHYSKDCPYYDVVDKVGDGGHYYELDSTYFPKWVKGFSEILTVEIFATATEDPISNDGAPSWLDPCDYELYEDATKQYIYLPNHAPASTKTIRVRHTARHELTDTTDTIPLTDYEAFVYLVAYYCSLVLAAEFSTKVNNQMASDQMSFRTLAQEWRDNAKIMLARYYETVGRPVDGSAAAAFATRDTDALFPWGEDLLLHPKRWR